ncbi:MAG: tyrosine-protein phosphatase [Dehalococcoidia bacterium]|nr:tyrosine-protein phosphatase [Dehalococcoidia bacterium]
MVIAFATRDIDIEIAFNVRHLGGYSTRNGKESSHELIRSASLHRLTHTGVGNLREIGVSTVVDFRSSAEREREATPDLRYAGIDVVHAPVFEEDASPVGLSEEFPGFAKVYEHFLEEGARAYRTLFETVARREGAVLFHCAAGKDRTGVAAALLLQLAGVGNADIIEDYTRSAELLRPWRSGWEPKMAERGVSEERAEQLMASNAEDMAATLAFIGMRWGDAEGYLESIGLSRADISAVRAR